MVAERNQIPDRPSRQTADGGTQCNGCGARQEVFNGHGILSCAYCGGSKAARSHPAATQQARQFGTNSTGPR